MLRGVTVMLPVLITDAPYLFFSSSGCVWTIKGTLVFLHFLPPSLPKLAVHSEPFCLWLLHLPQKEVLWFWSHGCWSARPVPFVRSGLVWFQLGGLHSLAGAHWDCPDGHLERCVTGAPCWCFCSCCFTCWMISLIFLCAVCGSRGEYVYSGKCLTSGSI